MKMSSPSATASCRPSPALMMSALRGCCWSAIGFHLVTNWKQVGVEAEALAQLAQVQVEIPRQIIDDPAGPAALMMRHIIPQVLRAFGRRRQAGRLENPLRPADVI